MRLPHGGDLREVLRPALCRLQSATFAECPGGLGGRKVVGELEGRLEQFTRTFCAALMERGCGQDGFGFRDEIAKGKYIGFIGCHASSVNAWRLESKRLLFTRQRSP